MPLSQLCLFIVFIHSKLALLVCLPVATYVGGCFVMGLSEMIYTPSMGLTSAVSMLASYSLSFIVGKYSKIIL